MADAVSHTSKTQAPVPEVPSDRANPSKFFSHFLYKAALVTVFLVLLPLFPSLAPEFINQTLHARSWELLQLICVGIAVSYGLFSKKNDETEKDHSSRIDYAQSYVSKLLQVSSVFDDESESHTVIDENKVRTWNSQYYRGEPIAIVAKEGPGVTEENCAASEISQKPLLLPVRSLKQRVSEPNEVHLADESGGQISSVDRVSMNSGSKRFLRNSRKSRNGDIVGLDARRSEDRSDDSVVLPSPIPWRSRSGRMDVKESGDGPSPFLAPPSMEEPELNRVESRSFKSSRPNSSFKNLSSPLKPSPSTPYSSDSPAKDTEDMVRKKKFSSPPPAPPPPPPPTLPFPRKPVLKKSNSTATNNAATSEKVLRRSVRSAPAEEPSERQTEEPPRRMNPGSQLGKSVRTFRPSEMVGEADKSFEKKGYADTTTTDGWIPKEGRQTYGLFPNDETNELVEKAVLESSDDENSVAENEVDCLEGTNPGNGEAAVDDGANELGPDVDKKADEFIAKFREQIRLQRIESIRRSTAERAGRTVR